MSSLFNHRGKSFFVIAAILIVAALGYAFLGAPRSEPSAKVETLLVGDQRGAIRSLLQAAGELDDVPYPIEWATFAVGAPLVEAIKSGAVDFGYVGSSTMTFGLTSGSPLKAITVWRFQGPGSGLLVRPDGPIRSVADLSGKRIAVVRGSPAHLFVVRLLMRAGISPDKVDLVFLTPGDAKAALSSGAIDGWAIWDPYLAIGEREDHLKVLAVSKGISDEVECGVASEHAITQKRAQLLDFLERVRRAYRWSETHQDEVAKVYATETGLPLDIARFVRGRMKIEVLPQITDDVILTHQKGADTYAEIGVIPKRVDVSAVYDRTFVLPAI